MSGQLKGLVGTGGVFQIYRTDASKINGSGENGEILFEDLWECTKDQDGNIHPIYTEGGKLKAKVPITEERQFHNKWTKRGLSYMLYRSLRGHSAGAYNANVSDITHSGTVNPFLAFVLFSDDVASSKNGDARPVFSESDGSSDALLSPNTGVIGQGRRGILLSATTGTFKRVSILHVGTDPYGILEYTFYAQPNSPAIQTGNLGLDDFPIMAVGMANGVACGSGEANSFIGIRAVCGKAPTFQGVSDRIYVHEGQQQGEDVVAKEYALDDDIAGEVAGDPGYIQDGELTAVQIDSTTTPAGAADTITVATRRITLSGATVALSTTSGFNANAHTRKVLRIAGSGTAGNNRDFTIQEVVDANTVVVFETPASNDAGNLNAFTGSVYTSYAGHNAFDGRVLNYGRIETVDTGTYPVPADSPGTIEVGEFWASPDTVSAHVIGRVFGSTVNNLSGVRIMIPAGVNIDFVPNGFVIQYLDPTANGGNPRPGYNADWVTVSSGTKSSVGQTIFDAGVIGIEYTFTPVNARGIRLSAMGAYASTRMCQVAELLAFTNIQSGNELSFSSNTLRLKTYSADSYTEYVLDDVTATTSLTDIVASLNKSLRGYQMEALRSTFGHLWLRGTVAGDESEVWIDNAELTSAATMLELPVIATQTWGITQPVTKLNTDAVTIVYRVFLTGDVPGGYPA